MAKVKGRDTAPELLVRSLLHRMGYRFRLYRKDLPGNPDIVLPKHRKAIFVHGCFWHGHKGCKRASRPSTRIEFWNKKIDGNIQRDIRVRKKLEASGWKVLVVWECKTKKPNQLIRMLERFLIDKQKAKTDRTGIRPT